MVLMLLVVVDRHHEKFKACLEIDSVLIRFQSVRRYGMFNSRVYPLATVVKSIPRCRRFSS